MADKKKIVILGNGPSMRGFDFNKLNNVDTIGLNAAYRYWDTINWYPTYYCCLDTELLKTHKYEIKRLLIENKVKKIFVRSTFLELVPELKNNPNVLVYETLCTEKYFCSSEPLKITTGSHSIRFALHLGYKQVYLLGIHCRYVEIIREATKIENSIKLVITKTPKNNPNYFFNEYQQKGDRYHIPNPHLQTENLHLRVFDILSNDIKKYKFDCKIVNCNMDSLLYSKKIFSYKNIDAVLKINEIGAIVINGLGHNKLMNVFLNLSHRKPFTFIEKKCQVDILCLVTDNFDLGLRRQIRKLYHSSDNLKQLNLKFIPITKCASSIPYNQILDYMMLKLGNYTSVLFLENNAYPIKDNWLCDIIEHKKNKKSWIIATSASKLDDSLTPTGIYSVRSNKFKNFYYKIFLPWHNDRFNKTKKMIPYNVSLDIFFKVHMNNKIERLYYSGYVEKFIKDNFIEKGRGVYDENNIKRLRKNKKDLIIVIGNI